MSITTTTAQDAFEKYMERYKGYTSVNLNMIRGVAEHAYLAGREQGLQEAAEVVKTLERERFEAVGNPMIHTFTPWFANAILRMRGE